MASTLYIYRRCCAKIQRQRNIQSLMAFRRGRTRTNDASNARSHEVIEDFEIVKSEARMESSPTAALSSHVRSIGLGLRAD
jgi:hypothetical protein